MDKMRSLEALILEEEAMQGNKGKIRGDDNIDDSIRATKEKITAVFAGKKINARVKIKAKEAKSDVMCAH